MARIVIKYLQTIKIFCQLVALDKSNCCLEKLGNSNLLSFAISLNIVPNV